MDSRLRIPDSRPMRPTFRTALKSGLIRSSSHASRGWRISYPLGLAIIAAAFGGTVATAAVYEHFRPVTNFNTAHCYSIDSASSNGTLVAVAGPIGSPEQVTNAIGTCSMLWRDGFLVSGVSHVMHITETEATTVHRIPALVVCTMPNGTAGVFPGPHTLCRKLGLPSPTRK